MLWLVGAVASAMTIAGFLGALASLLGDELTGGSSNEATIGTTCAVVVGAVIWLAYAPSRRGSVVPRDPEAQLRRQSEAALSLIARSIIPEGWIPQTLEDRMEWVNYPHAATDLKHPSELSGLLAQVTRRGGSGPSLVILGEPGHGKTALVIELAKRWLTSPAGDADRAAIPALLQLSDWSADHESLEHWAAAQLSGRDAPLAGRKAEALDLIEQDRVLLCLDGLDEISGLEDRRRCAEAINAYRGPALIACRIAEYEEMIADQHRCDRLAAMGAVELLPFTPTQIGNRINELTGTPRRGGGEARWSGYEAEAGKLRAAIMAGNEPVADLARAPLYGGMLVEWLQGDQIETLLGIEEADEGRHLLIDGFLTGLERKWGRPVIPWAAALATFLDQTGRRITFRFEDLTPRRHRGSGSVAAALLFGLLFGLLSWLPFGLVFGLLSGLVFGLLSGLLLSGLLIGLFVAAPIVCDASRITVDRAELLSGLLSGLLFGLLSGLLFGLLSGLLFGLPFGLLYGLPIGLLHGLDEGGGYVIAQRLAIRRARLQGLLPGNPADTLEDACRDRLMRRVTGGVQFRHRAIAARLVELDRSQGSLLEIRNWIAGRWGEKLEPGEQTT